MAERIIDYFTDEYRSYQIDKGELVRCKDCIFGDRRINGRNEEMIYCSNDETGIEEGFLRKPNWFCAEGVRENR